MSRAFAAAEKHMESERRHSNELIREMRSIMAEGSRRLDEKRERRMRKEAESQSRLAQGQQVIAQMSANIAEMKNRQMANRQLHKCVRPLTPW
jgi:hypothetical protein